VKDRNRCISIDSFTLKGQGVSKDSLGPQEELIVFKLITRTEKKARRKVDLEIMETPEGSRPEKSNVFDVVEEGGERACLV